MLPPCRFFSFVKQYLVAVANLLFSRQIPLGDEQTTDEMFLPVINSIADLDMLTDARANGKAESEP
jgi:hypothetical protein